MEAPTQRVLGPAGGRYREMEGKKPGRGLCGGILGWDGMEWGRRMIMARAAAVCSSVGT